MGRAPLHGRRPSAAAVEHVDRQTRRILHYRDTERTGRIEREHQDHHALEVAGPVDTPERPFARDLDLPTRQRRLAGLGWAAAGSRRISSQASPTGNTCRPDPHSCSGRSTYAARYPGSTVAPSNDSVVRSYVPSDTGSSAVSTGSADGRAP